MCGDGLPLPVFVLHVAGTLLVAADFAQVMKQGHDGDGLVAVFQAVELLHPLPLEIVHQAVIHVQAVLAQAPLVGAVVPGGGGGGEEVTLVGEKVQQLVRPVPGDAGFENVDEFLFAGHN